MVTWNSFGADPPPDGPGTSAGTDIAGSVDPHPRNGLDRTGPTGGYPATVFQRCPRLTLVGIAVASFVVVVALIQFAGDLAT